MWGTGGYVMTVLLRTVLPACLAPHCGAYLPVVEAQSNIPPKLRMRASLLFSNFSFHRQLSNCNNLPPKLLPLLASISSLKRAASKMRPIVGQPTPSNQQSRVIRER
ncbi:hypothetical protein QC761_0048770 [Podospora bellae-mahoneyi]|uniref:Secreted protein n=1 Tax=Podospora bellae-mahoneyi TaxID=2093777 RepID=A0ABR0FMQ3_9PEZI|nr:hypothetical protein QC761_0048770 [Podospora bellae-mahoneyi]